MADVLDVIYKEIGESDYNQDVKDWLSIGYLPLNKAISGNYFKGGLPVGRIIEIFGASSAGKTLLATMACIETQKRDGLAVFLDHEHAFSLSRAVDIGLDDDRTKWIYKQPTTAEESFHAIEFISKTIRTGYPEKFVTVIVDSVASMVTKSEMDTNYGDENMKTRLSLPVVMSTCLKKLAAVVSKTNITLIFLNQTRDNPGVMFGDKKSTPGGNALKFFASVRISVSKIKKLIDKNKEFIGDMVKATVVKNKVGVPYKTATYQTSQTHGIDLTASHINALSDMGKLGSTKNFVEFEGKKYRKKELGIYLEENPEKEEDLLALFEDQSANVGNKAEADPLDSLTQAMA